MTSRGKQLALFASKKGCRHVLEFNHSGRTKGKGKIRCEKYTKPKRIFSSKFQMKAYMTSKEIDIRVGSEAFEEVENILEDFLDKLLEIADENKKKRNSKVLSGKDIIMALSHEDMNIDSIRNS